jgi:excisionase family DNA binding protein
MSDDERLMTVKEVADLLRFNAPTIIRMCKDAELVGAFQAQGRWRIPRSAVAAYIAQQQAQTAAV